MTLRTFFLIGSLLTSSLSCGVVEAIDRESNRVIMIDTPRSTASGWVDSVIPLNEALAIFREQTKVVTGLGGGASSKSELINNFLTALENRDTSALFRMVLSRDEFAHLYYPDHPQSKPPYELTPQLMWFHMSTNSDKGLRRALRDFGGKSMPRTHECSDSISISNGNRIHTNCSVTLSDSSKVVLFSAVLERNGMYKVLSYINKL